MMVRRNLVRQLVQGSDLLLMVLSFGLATWLEAYDRIGGSLTTLLAVRLKLLNLILFLGFLLLWHLIFDWVGLYRQSRLVSMIKELLDVFKATSLGSLAILNAAIVFKVQLLSPRFIAVFWITSFITTVLFRILLRSLLEAARKKGRNQTKAVIVGTNERALRFAEKIESSPALGYSLIGFVDDPWDRLEELYRRGRKLVCGFEELPEFLRSNVVDEVIIALPASSSYQRSAAIVAQCENQGIVVRILSDFFNLRIARARVDVFQDNPVISLYTGAMEGTSLVLKRGLDFGVALGALFVQIPLFMLIGVLIKFSSPGPVIFAQERIGLNTRRFRLYKFRTMANDAEDRQKDLERLNEASGPVFKIRDDPRITKIGQILRRTSLDEMPQLLNVLIGDMSLVGPRPLPVRDWERFGEDWHRRRFSVRPGITCLWQVTGRSGLPFEKWMELDMKYIDEWSLWLDFKILLKTIPAVLKGEGAV